MNTAATAIIGHTYGHTGHIPTVCVAVVVAICATPATFVAVVAGVATASVWDLRSSISEHRGRAAGQFGISARPFRATGRRRPRLCPKLLKADRIHIEMFGPPSKKRRKLALGPAPTKTTQGPTGEWDT